VLWPVELGREESRRCLQNRVGPSQFSVLAFQPFEFSGFLGRRSHTRTGIDLGLAHPLAHRLRAADAEQAGDLTNRRPLRAVLITDLGDHPHRPLTQLRRIPPPGVEFRGPDSAKVEGEADVLVILRNGALILGECKTSARGLKPEEIEKLWTAADHVGARATFSATLDRAAECGADWRTLEAPGGRPHFALTAEHPFDLDCMGPVFGDDLFEWRDDDFSGFSREPDDAKGQDRELLVDKVFSEYIEQTGKDYEQH